MNSTAQISKNYTVEIGSKISKKNMKNKAGKKLYTPAKRTDNYIAVKIRIILHIPVKNTQNSISRDGSVSDQNVR